MMHQGGNPQVQLRLLQEQQLADDDIDQVFALLAVTDDQQTEELKSHKQDALCKIKTKRSLAYYFVELRTAILEDINTVDPDSSKSLKACVKSILEQWHNNNVIEYTKNNDLIPCLMSIFRIAETLTNALEQYQLLLCGSID